MFRINNKEGSIYITKLKRKEAKEMEEKMKTQTTNIISNIYERPFITCMLFGTFCVGIATVVSAFKN